MHPAKKIQSPSFPRFDGDIIDVDSLIRLVGTRTTTDVFGYLLRPYWTPATILDYRTRLLQHVPRSEPVEAVRSVSLEPIRIDADAYTWRERITASYGGFYALIQCSAPRKREEIVVYDRSEQTFRRPAILGIEPSADETIEAKNQAFLHLPILPPLLPIPLGFQWHVRNENGFLDFMLESAQAAEGMTVLFIRRRGEFLLDKLYRSGNIHHHRFYVKREGITAYALERSVVLEDRTRDVFRSESSPSDIDGTETVTIRTLERSHLPVETRPLAPLFVKYRTEKHPYIYDCGTGRILQTNEAVYEIIDDYRVLSPNELAIRYPRLDRNKIQQTVKHLDSLREDGYLSPHEPTEPSRIEVVQRGSDLSTLSEFWTKYGTLLVLGLTERCNLNCSYCCYSGKFEGQRTHTNRVMSFEVAQKAITSFLERELAKGEKYPITFYGGEPLLEFELLRKCVCFAVEHAASTGKKVRFSVTTNGTLLTDDVTDFLVEHDFVTLVSLDGPKQSHDRYRVFPNGKGSFETVNRNLWRFVERYPDYKKRGLNITLAPPLELEETARFVDELAPYYPIIRAALVSTSYEQRFTDDEKSPMQYGCSTCTSCETKPSLTDEAFRRFSSEDAAQLKPMWDAVIESVAKIGASETRDKMPFTMGLFGPQIGLIHQRPVTKTPPEWTFFVPCVPGFTRRFVGVDGKYRVCERVDHSESYVVGDVESGLDPLKMERIVEMRRHFGDCGNCTAVKTCDICYARIPKSDEATSGYDPQFDLLCRRTRRTREELLPIYTRIMERNPKAFELSTSGDVPLPEVPLRFGSPGSRLDEKMKAVLIEEKLHEACSTQPTYF